MKFRIFIVLLIATSLNAYAQGVKIKEKEVPENVQNFARDKYPEIAKFYWNRYHDNYIAFYKADILFKDLPRTAYIEESRIYITPDGKWIETRHLLDPNTIPNSLKTFFKQNYVGSEKVYYFLESPKKDEVYLVEILDESMNPYLEVYMNKKVKFVREVEIITEVHTTENDVVEENNQNLELESGEEWMSATQEVKPSELPSTITVYLKKNHEEDRIKRCVMTKTEQDGVVYQITLKRAGFRKLIVLYFTVGGNYIRTEEKEE